MLGAAYLIGHGLHLLQFGDELVHATSQVLDFPGVMPHLLLVHPCEEGVSSRTDCSMLLLCLPSAALLALARKDLASDSSVFVGSLVLPRSTC